MLSQGHPQGCHFTWPLGKHNIHKAEPGPPSERDSHYSQSALFREQLVQTSAT